MQIHNGDLVDGRYRIEEDVYIAGFSPGEAPVRLCNATDEQLERPVTLQFLSASEARDPTRLQRFVRNGQLASALHHPHVAGVYDAGEWNGWPYWVMSRYAGPAVESLYGEEDAPPNVAPALAATRKAAEALQAVRDAGMRDWTFSHQALRVSSSSDICLYPIMGLEKLPGDNVHFSSSAPKDDPLALSDLLRLLLVGTQDPRAGTRMLALPAHVLALLHRMRMDGDVAPGRLAGAGEVAAAISELEASALEPTQAYAPSHAASEAPLAMPYYGPSDSSTAAPAALVAAPVPASASDAPTLAAPVPPPQATRATAPMQARPYVPVAQAPPPRRKRPGLLPVLPLLALLLLAGAVALLWPKTNTASGSLASNGTAAAPTAQAQPAVVPNVRGKTLEEANGEIGLAGLRMGQTGPVRDPNFAANTVARQVPDPGTPLQPGGVVTITLSLGPEPTLVPQPQEPAAQPGPPEEKKDKDDDKEEEKDDKKKDDKKKDDKKDD